MASSKRTECKSGPNATIRFVDPALNFSVAAAAVLADEASRDGVVDLGRWLVVVPGARAGRLLLRALVLAAAERNAALEAPTITTVGGMVERAFRPADEALEEASRLERRLAWEATLAHADADEVRLFVPRGRTADALLWRRMAATVVRLEDDLGAADRDFAAAANAVREAQGDPARLEALDRLAPRVSERLAAIGLTTPRSARDSMIERGAPAFDRIVTVGTLELAAPQRRALDRAGDVLSIVAARAEHHHRFDGFGAATVAWHDAPLSIADAAIVTAESPRDVAECGLRLIAERVAAQPALAVDEVAIALADAELADIVILAGRDAGIDVHVAAGVPFLATSVGRTLSMVAAYRTSRRPADLAALLRRPAFERHIAARLRGAADDDVGDLLAALDDVRQERLPVSLDQPLGEGSGVLVRRCVEAIDDWMAQFERPGGLVEAFARLPWEDGDRAALERLRAMVTDVEAISEELRGAVDPLELILDECKSLRIPAEPRERAVEAIGWLELLFEPAPHVVVLGMNEGCVPSGGGSDPMLPESVRERLGMATRSQRAARDAALLDALLARAPSTRFVVGRRSEDGEALVPSRLLLRLRGADLARRVASLTDHSKAMSGSRGWRRSVQGPTGFIVPTPSREARDIEVMSVTGFRSYLACGTRFWLERIERIELVDDDPREIPIPDLGTLVHATLKAFADDSSLQAISDPDVLDRELLSRFDAAATRAFGSAPLPAVRLQIDIMRRRFAPFAAWQVAHAAEGWSIRRAEVKLPSDFLISPMEGAPMRITGQIDRIDFHPARKAWRIIDYKTGDAGTSPRESHRSGKGGRGPWMDLQLPLYREGMRALLEREVAGSTIDVGYVRLPSNPRAAGWCSADFGAEELDDALGVARKVVSAIRRGEFPLGDPMGWDDPYEGILQTFVFGGDDRPRDLEGKPTGNGGDA